MALNEIYLEIFGFYALPVKKVPDPCSTWCLLNKDNNNRKEEQEHQSHQYGFPVEDMSCRSSDPYTVPVRYCRCCS